MCYLAPSQITAVLCYMYIYGKIQLPFKVILSQLWNVNLPLPLYKANLS
jgi:hypothetical protein